MHGLVVKVVPVAAAELDVNARGLLAAPVALFRFLLIRLRR